MKEVKQLAKRIYNQFSDNNREDLATDREVGYLAMEYLVLYHKNVCLSKELKLLKSFGYTTQFEIIDNAIKNYGIEEG